MSRSKPVRKPTIQQRALVAALADGKTLSEAGRKAEYSAQSNARKAFVNKVERLLPLMDTIGLTEEYILVKLKNGIEADKQEWAQYQGKYTDVVEVPDNSMRMKAIETAARIRRMFPERESGEDGKATVAVQIITNVQLDKP